MNIIEKKVSTRPFSPNPIWESCIFERACAMFGTDWRERTERGEYRLTGSCGTLSWINLFDQQFLRTLCLRRGAIENDLPNGDPAVIDFYPDGSIRGRRYYSKGIARDPNKITPATMELYPNGAILGYVYRRNGVPTDSAYGHPKYVRYLQSGEIEIASSADGELTPDAARTLIDLANKRAGADLCSNRASVMAGLTNKGTDRR